MSAAPIDCSTYEAKEEATTSCHEKVGACFDKPEEEQGACFKSLAEHKFANDSINCFTCDPPTLSDEQVAQMQKAITSLTMNK